MGCNKGDLYIAIDIGRFRDVDLFLDDMEELAAIVRASGEGVLLPGEPEQARVKAANGEVVLDDDLAQQTSALGSRYGVAAPM